MAQDAQTSWPVHEVSRPERVTSSSLWMPTHNIGTMLAHMKVRVGSSLQIIYTAIVGLVMCAALVEWFLWMAAFLYCLCKVYKKAEHWTINALAVVVGIAFVFLRYGHHGLSLSASHSS